MHASFFFGGKKEGKKPLGLRETCNYHCALYHHFPRSLHPKPGESFILLLCIQENLCRYFLFHGEWFPILF